MGRANIQHSTAAPPPKMSHFSHPHILYLNHSPQATFCSGCKLQTSRKNTYTCQSCNFTLHQSCANLPKLITHPSHPCTLTLLTHPAYPGGVFMCDACKFTDNGWSYHCNYQNCNYDLHVTCASKPLKIRHHSHVTCHLDLTFKDPYPGNKRFLCDVCKKEGGRQWLYRCHTCGFDVHMDCSKETIHHHYQHQQPMLQHHYSFPAATANNLVHPQLRHSASYAAGQIVQPTHQYVQPVETQPVMIQQNNNTNKLGSNLMSSAMNGFVEGAFQTAGQTILQSLLS